MIRLRTRRKSQSSSGVAAQKGEAEESLSVHPAVELPTSPQPNRQHHQGQNHKRSAKERRTSPATTEELSTAANSDGQHSVESLTRGLDAVRNEIQDTEAQIANAEEEFKATEGVLRSELDALREKKNEEDAGRQRMRAEAKALEEQRRSAEAAQTRTRKALQAKEAEIKKLHDDIARWGEEKRAAVEKMEKLSSAAEESKENAVTTEKELSVDIQEISKQISEMEDEIRSVLANIKVQENEKEQLKARQEDEDRQDREDSEKERQWREHQRTLEMRYVSVYNAFQATEVDFMRSREALAQALAIRNEVHSAGDSIPKKQKQRRNRNRKGRTQTISSPINAYPHDARFQESNSLSAMPFQQHSPLFSTGMSSNAYFNIANGSVTSPMDIPNLDTGPIMDLTGSAPMSPTANALLPSNLFSFDDPPSPGPRLASFDQNREIDSSGFMGPQSPMSSGSVSTSPRSSFNPIPSFPALGGHRGSIGETAGGMSPIGSNRPGSTSTLPEGDAVTSNTKDGGRRFVRLLSNSFTRQRGKTMPFDGPTIGSLRTAESHSVPKPDTDLDPIGTRRRSGSYGSWTNGFDFLHGSKTAKPKSPETGEHYDRSTARHSANLSQFTSAFDPLDPTNLFQLPTSPRPSSIHSFDNPLPTPSSTASLAFGWPSTSPPQNHRNKFALVGNNWTDFRTGRISRTRPVSPAFNNSTASLSLLPTSSSTSFFGPSGHSNSARPVTPRLNPTAPTFQSRHATPARERDEEEREQPPATPETTYQTPSIASGTSLDTVPTKESILSRFSALSRKGSTSKFNLNWKGKDKKPESDDEGGIVEREKRGLWGWKGGKKDENTSETEEIEEEKESDVEGSGWTKGVFGGMRKKVVNEELEEPEKEGVDGAAEKEKKRLGSIFRRRGERKEEVGETGKVAGKEE